MDPTPCLISSPSTFGQRLVFGLLTDEGFHPVRGMPVNKVRWLGEPKIVLPNKPVIHALGDVCVALLDAAEVWEVMLHAMAEDIYQSTKKLPRANSKAMAVFTQEYKAASEAPVVDLWGNVHD